MPKLNDAITLENHITPLTPNLREGERQQTEEERDRQKRSRKSACRYHLKRRNAKYMYTFV